MIGAGDGIVDRPGRGFEFYLRVARKDVPANRTREMRWLDHDEVERLVVVVDGQWDTLRVTLAYTGLRWGEAAALRRGRCHLLRRQLHVVESLSGVGGDLTFAEPKSKKSVRWVDLPGSSWSGSRSI